jgi:hypothetical protein
LESQPVNTRLSFNVAVYLCALGREDEAEARVLATLATGPWPPEVRDCVDDLEQLQRATGKNVERQLALLRANVDGRAFRGPGCR